MMIGENKVNYITIRKVRPIMKEYKFIHDTFPRELTKKVNKYIKKGYLLEDWKLSDNAIVVLLSKENQD